MQLVRLVTVAAVLSTALTSCGDDGDVTLRVKVWSDWEFVGDAAAEFERSHPGVDVIVEGITGSEYFETLPQVLASSESPDITALQVIPGIYSDLIDDGLLADLSSVWNSEELSDVYRAATVQRYTTDEGKQFAISTALQWFPVVYYNMDVFDELGLVAPVDRTPTTEEWDSIVSGSLAAGIVPLSTIGISDEYGLAFLLGSMLRSSCGDSFYAEILTGWQTPNDAAWSDTCAVAAIENIAAWADAGVLGESPASRSAESSVQLFFSGGAAMFEGGSWSIQGLAEANLEFGIDWFLLPPTPGGIDSTVMLGDYDGLGVSARSAHQDLAREFLALIASKEFEATESYFLTAGFPPRSDVDVPIGIDQMAISQFEQMNVIGTSIQLTVAVPYHPQIQSLLASFIAGQIDARTVAQQLDEAAAKALSG